ncbi:MAG TPA: 1-deoxy-D-xylulose-5-phosphate reductoisomerase [Marinilabiliales bacterium]|jgi:1-deoxy-D-xylulose-5-phosphate reductoisomerase|nr:MAG: 1-deoxy-D-xylulose-5-phosphate reductoisomerase [Bacteroidetes bacterium GWA2_40_14]OFX65386.1 MAG: 1-deoxy-D-xylulose-5-phosphate reductoisomerase [Bacteroidetes bacterium GWC2_40_13]OFX73511.1 MAG: 1-deoxy-D-xylulose-5-phosphate reductoisomerase [Bacteroidetes bacterium GWD2_40_43]OFX90813.1 MAG: 1-deoxy-D-xylulose-5-phosphate reductoisomerase [Bacteroidetes bacterium GWE2_40_63]OFY20555.1 MAG: 1-deoxy-D-xylulose-5-phosphate reductoisomerase [Bacteroidetes bacterium GWF2_40_13]OFZ241
MPKHLALLGSTGSIGTQTLEVVKAHPDELVVEVITANRNADLLIQQAREFLPNAVVIADENLYQKVKEALLDSDIKVFAGQAALNQVVQMGTVDTVVTAMVGYSGLLPTVKAIEAGKNIALANKETLVVAGDLIARLIQKHQVFITPIDSEHSAIFQCLAGEPEKIEKIILTASGGPFRTKTLDELKKVTPAQALKHPNWDMGAKITIDSATMMNKGLEVVEAKWLFGVQNQQIEVVVHPQSIIHSMVQFTDGSIKAQMGLPDMKLPIQYALSFPDRWHSSFPRMDFRLYPNLTFEQPDFDKFHCLALAYEALEKGGNLPAIINAANEIAVAAFLKEKIGFLQIPLLIEKAMNGIGFIKNPTLDDYIATDTETRKLTQSFL